MTAPADGLTIEYRDVASIQGYARNTRTHSTEQVDQIAASIKEFGFTSPILIDADGTIIAGHGRLRAALLIGMAKVPTITLPNLTDEQRRALTIADNKIALNAGWDGAMLKIELEALREASFDLSLTGFDPKELAKMMDFGTKGDPDAETNEKETPSVVVGDVWLLGSHRLVCGDSTDPLVVAKALNGVVPSIMVTDPPYGVEMDGAKRAAGFKDGSNRATSKIDNDDKADWREALSLFPGPVAYVWYGFRRDLEARAAIEAAGFEVRSQVVWVKKRPVQLIGNINPKTMGYNPAHECCYYVVRKGGKPDWWGNASQSTVWSDIEHLKNDTGHSSQKPCECMERPIRNNTSPGQAVYEPFCGSGTTLIACEHSGRVCHAVEVNPGWVEAAILRWQEMTGLSAVFEPTGQTFLEVLGDRTPGRKITGKTKGR